MPKFFKYFDSFDVDPLPLIDYREVFFSDTPKDPELMPVTDTYADDSDEALAQWFDEHTHKERPPIPYREVEDFPTFADSTEPEPNSESAPSTDDEH